MNTKIKPNPHSTMKAPKPEAQKVREFQDEFVPPKATVSQLVELAHLLAVNYCKSETTIRSMVEEIKNLKELDCPLKAALFALEIASYLPDSAEEDLRRVIRHVL